VIGLKGPRTIRYKSRLRDYKLYAKAGRDVCRRWRNIFYESFNTNFRITHLILQCNSIQHFSVRDLIKFRRELTSVQEGDEIFIYFILVSWSPEFRGKTLVNDLPRDTSQKLRLFVHAMFFITPIQHQICGLRVHLQIPQVYMHFLELLSSLQLPSLTYLGLGYTEMAPQEMFGISRIREFEPLLATKRNITNLLRAGVRLRYLSLSSIDWLDDQILGTSSTASLALAISPGYLISLGSWSNACKSMICKTLTHLTLYHYGKPRNIEALAKVGQIFFPKLRSLAILQPSQEEVTSFQNSRVLDSSSLHSILGVGQYPLLLELRIEGILYWSLYGLSR